MADLLSAGDLARMRAQQENYLPQTAVIERYSTSADGMGGFTESWTAVGTVSCRLRPMEVEQREMVAGEQMISESRWIVTVPHGTDVTAKDRLQISSRTFQVTFVNNDEGYQTAVRCECTAFNEEQRS